MKLSKFSILLAKLLLFFLCGISSFLVANPKVDRANLRYGFSPRIKRYSWGVLNCRIVNPDPRPYDVEIRFVDANRGAITQKTVFADTVTIPAGTVIKYSSPVMTEDAEEYRLEVFVAGQEQGKGDSFLISLISGNSSYLVVLNDSEDVSLGAFATAPKFKGKYALSNFMAKAPPAPWNLIKKAACIVVVRPDFKRFSAEAFRAILDYVYQGGQIVFVDPQGAIEASKTPLSVLLPVNPLRVRKVTSLSELTKNFPRFKEFSKPVDFLESVPVGDGINYIEKEGMPIFRWKKYGLGTCRFSAVPVLSEAYKDTEAWHDILSFFIANQLISNDLSTAVPVLDEMTGFTVPGISSVRMIFFIYFLMMIIPLGLGILLKRTGLAWIVTCVITVCFSVYILKVAASSHSKQSGTFVSFIETEIPGKTAAPAEGWYGIFSTADRKVTIEANNEQTALSAIPPPDNIMAMFKRTGSGIGAKSFTTPTEVKKINALPEINNLVLNSNASRQFYASYNSVGHKGYREPEVVYKKDGFEFKDWEIPGDFKPYAAWLQFANGIFPLEIKNGKIFLQKTASAGVFSSDTTLLFVKDFMQKGWKHNSPMLVMIENSDEPLLKLPKEIVPHGKKLTVIPIKEVCDEKIFSVPPQAVLFTAGDTSTRLVMTGNEIKPEIISRSDSDYIFRYQLPPVFAGLKAKEITVDFKYMNDGGNVEIKPVLVVGEILNKKFVSKYAPKPAASQSKRRNKRNQRKKRNQSSSDNGSEMAGLKGELKNGKYVFSNVQECLNNGTGFIGLNVKIKRKNLPMGERLRANKWSLNKLDITVTGSMPESASAFKF